jgi:hypothetical protein
MGIGYRGPIRLTLLVHRFSPASMATFRFAVADALRARAELASILRQNANAFFVDENSRA